MQNIASNRQIPPFELEHSIHFSRYTERTDGKTKIARAVTELGGITGRTTLLDLGAGDGLLTSLLAREFDNVIAVEKNPAYFSRLSTIPRVTLVPGHMENFKPDAAINLILACYSLSGVAPTQLPSFIETLRSSLAPSGVMTFVTYADGCTWDTYAEQVCQRLNIERTGGMLRHTSQLNDLGISTRLLKAVPTYIWDINVPSLAETLGFFFLRKIDEYRCRMVEFEKLLESLTVDHEAGVAIEVTENLVQIL